MEEEKLVEAVRTFDCLWKVSAKVYRDARAKENTWKAVTRTDRTCTYVSQPPFFSSASYAVPVATAAVALRLCRSPSLHVLEQVGPCVNTAYFGLTFDVQCATTLYCEQCYASIGIAQCHARSPRWLERRIMNPPLFFSVCGITCMCTLAQYTTEYSTTRDMVLKN